MLDRLDRLATSRRVLVALGAVIVLLTLANLRSTLFAAYTGTGILDLSGLRNILDVRPGLTTDGVYQLISSYGPDGRTYHLLITLLGEILLPASVFLFGARGLLHATRRLHLQPRWRRSPSPCRSDTSSPTTPRTSASTR